MQDAGAARNRRTENGPSGTPAPTGCVYLGAPVFGKPPIWTQQSRCTITDQRTHRMVRRSGSDKRIVSDSLYDDVRQFKSRVVRGGGFQRTPAAQEVLKPAVSSRPFGHFWGCGQK